MTTTCLESVRSAFASETSSKPLVKQLKNQSSIQVIRQLEEALAATPSGPATQTVAKEVEYFHEHQARMDYRAGQRAGEPIGSGSLEATCRQIQCRFKRPGQCWSQAGVEALLCLETFWRNGRWHLLFPHTPFNPARNCDAPVPDPGQASGLWLELVSIKLGGCNFSRPHCCFCGLAARPSPPN